MKSLSYKKESAMLIFCILILSALCIGIYYNGKDLSCDKCIIDFKTVKRPMGGRPQGEMTDVSVSIPILYEHWQEGECYLIFDGNGGFKINE